MLWLPRSHRTLESRQKQLSKVEGAGRILSPPGAAVVNIRRPGHPYLNCRSKFDGNLHAALSRYWYHSQNMGCDNEDGEIFNFSRCTFFIARQAHRKIDEEERSTRPGALGEGASSRAETPGLLHYSAHF